MKWESGGIPYGYKYNNDKRILEINKKEADTLKIIFSMRKSGFGVNNIADQLNRNKHKTRFGRTFSNNTIYFILRPQRLDFYSGYVDGEKGNWQPIITKAEAEKIKGMLSIRNKGRSRKHDRKYLLTKILRCGYCGSTCKSSNVHKANQIYRYYLCTNRQMHGVSQCPESKMLPMEVVEKAVITDIKIKWSKNLKSIFNDYKTFLEKDLRKEIDKLKSLPTAEIAEHTEIVLQKSRNLSELQFADVRFPNKPTIQQTKNIIMMTTDKIELFRDRIIISYKYPIDKNFRREEIIKL